MLVFFTCDQGGIDEVFYHTLQRHEEINDRRIHTMHYTGEYSTTWIVSEWYIDDSIDGDDSINGDRPRRAKLLDARIDHKAWGVCDPAEDVHELSRGKSSLRRLLDEHGSWPVKRGLHALLQHEFNAKFEIDCAWCDDDDDDGSSRDLVNDTLNMHEQQDLMRVCRRLVRTKSRTNSWGVIYPWNKVVDVQLSSSMDDETK